MNDVCMFIPLGVQNNFSNQSGKFTLILGVIKSQKKPFQENMNPC